MTGLVVTKAQFVAFVAEHRGDYTGEAAQVVRAFVESIGHDGAQLLRILTRQAPAYNLAAPGQTVPAPDGSLDLPVYEQGVHQVVPAQGLYRIGHVVRFREGWAGFHWRTPYTTVITAATQIEAVIAVYIAHFVTL